MEQVVVVDQLGKPIGAEEKIRAHADGGVLHLAFCILVFDPAGQLLLQRRADEKYHFSGLWSNTCCGHPRPGEGVCEAGQRRLSEEFGIRMELEPRAHFTYFAEDPVSGLAEYEFAHVLVGRAGASVRPAPDPSEIGAWAWTPVSSVVDATRSHGERYTPWFRQLLEEQPVAHWAMG